MTENLVTKKERGSRAIVVEGQAWWITWVVGRGGEGRGRRRQRRWHGGQGAERKGTETGPEGRRGAGRRARGRGGVGTGGGGRRGGLTISRHADEEALLEATVLAAVAIQPDHETLSVAQTAVLDLLLDAPAEETLRNARGGMRSGIEGSSGSPAVVFEIYSCYSTRE